MRTTNGDRPHPLGVRPATPGSLHQQNETAYTCHALMDAPLPRHRYRPVRPDYTAGYVVVDTPGDRRELP